MQLHPPSNCRQGSIRNAQSLPTTPIRQPFNICPIFLSGAWCVCLYFHSCRRFGHWHLNPFELKPKMLSWSALDTLSCFALDTHSLIVSRVRPQPVSWSPEVRVWSDRAQINQLQCNQCKYDTFQKGQPENYPLLSCF